MDGWLDYVEPIATAVAALVAIYAASDARRSAKAQQNDAALQSRETEKQGAIALEAMLIDYHKAILAWADEAINWISQSHSLTFFDPDRMPEGAFFYRRAECLCHLSALIDRGRVFFPNEKWEDHGLHKPRAFRGFRPIVLDQLKFVHDNIGELRSARSANSPEKLREEIVICKKQFVSEIQSVVDPQARQQRLKDILSAASLEAALKTANE